jgi:hypothetical protein
LYSVFKNYGLIFLLTFTIYIIHKPGTV